MDIKDVLTLPCVRLDGQGNSKKRVLEAAAELIAEHHITINANELFSALLTREKLGSTGVGNGIALPHCQLPSCAYPVATFIRLSAPLDFDALDHKPVDLLFVLVVPPGEKEEHLELLREVALYLKDPEVQQALRCNNNAESVYHTLTAELMS